MIKYIAHRILTMIPMLLGVSLIVFILMYLTPEHVLSEARASKDIPKEYILEMEACYGLNDPWYIQYLLWLKNIAMLDFGESWTFKVPVLELLAQRIPATLTLAAAAFLISWGIAIPIGVLAAFYKNSFFDRISSFLAYAALSIPEFFLALLAVLFAAQSGHELQTQQY